MSTLLVCALVLLPNGSARAGARDELARRYPWIELLGSDAATWKRIQLTLALGDRFVYSGLVRIDDGIAAVLLRALDLMSPDSAGAVRALGLGRLTPDALGDNVKGVSGPGAGTLLLSAQLLCDFPSDAKPAVACEPAPASATASARRGPTTTLVHEAAHCLAGLVEAISAHRANAWPAAVVARVSASMSRTLTPKQSSIERAFEDVQRRAVAAGAASDYIGGRADIGVGASGTFALGYGMYGAKEDVATWVAQIVFPRSATEERPYCAELAALRTDPKRMTPRLAVILEKLELLVGLGFLTETAVTPCTGGWPLRGAH